jgi:hypothetical protein
VPPRATAWERALSPETQRYSYDRMDDLRIRRRLFVAERILSSYDGEAKALDVLAEMDEADFDDPVLEELLDLFQHEPAKSRV